MAEKWKRVHALYEVVISTNVKSVREDGKIMCRNIIQFSFMLLSLSEIED